MPTKKEIIEKIENLTREKGFIYALAFILLQDLFLNPDKTEDINWQTRLNYQELSFLIGLMLKNKFTIDLVDEAIIQDQTERTYKLFKELHDAFMEPAKAHFSSALALNASKNKETPMESILGSGNMMAESIFYGDSGACDFQFLELALKKYHKDKKWIYDNKGFELDTLISVYKKLKDLHVQRVSGAKGCTSFGEFCKFALSFFCFNEEDVREFATKGLRNIINEFSIVPGIANKTLALPGEYNKINSHPIVILEDNLYFLPILFNFAQSIYESPFYWMVRDDKNKDISLKNRGDATVDIAHDLLANIFQSQNVYKEVKIEKNKKILTDIDLLAVTGNKAIVLQIKSKKLTELARSGDKDKLKQDFKTAVQEAYNQAIVSRSAIFEKGSRLLDLSGNEVKLDDSINEVYIICVTTDHYPAVASQTRVYLEKTSKDPYPIAISIFDLDVLTHYLKDPFEFLYYINQRIALFDYFIAINEIELLAWHLNRKLYRVKDEKSGKDIDVVWVDGMAQLMDAHFQCVRGGLPKTKTMERLYTKWANPEFQEIINQLKESKQAGFTDAIFFLYDLAGHGADQFIDRIKQLKGRCINEKKSLRLYMMDSHKKTAICYVCDYANGDKLFRHVLEYSEIKKYQTKSDLCLAIGGVATSPKNFEVAMFSKSPWRQDPKLDEIAKMHYSKGDPINIKSGEKIGRNDPCWCGSGKKYKKCCGK